MRTSPIALALAAVLLLGGCATAPDAQSSSPSASPPPSIVPSPPPASGPSPTATGAAPVLEPTRAFGGDCTTVLSSAQLGEILGSGWKTYEDAYREWNPDVLEEPALASLGTLGGLECRWIAGEASAQSSGVDDLGVVVLPAEQVPPVFAADFASVRCDPAYDVSICRLAKTVDDSWIMARTRQLGENVPVEFLERAIAEVAASAGDSLGAQAADRLPGWWDLPECDALAEDMHLAELIGDDYGTGYWEGSEQPEQTLLAEAGVEVSCPWFTGDSSRAPDGEFYIIDVTVASGAGWQWESIQAAEASTAVQVPGADSAVAIERAARSNDVVYATDGVNVIEVGGSTSDFLVRVAERALAALAR